MNNEIEQLEMVQGLKDEVKQKCRPHEVRLIDLFFAQRTFCPEGQTQLLKLFLSVKENKKRLKRAIKHCRIEWRTNWSAQHHLIRGSINDWGTQAINIFSLEHVYSVLEIPCPVFLAV